MAFAAGNAMITKLTAVSPILSRTGQRDYAAK